MSAVRRTGRRVALTAAGRAWLAVAILCVATPAVAQTSVYRCVEPGGRVLYTDYACRNGEVVELHPGKADPDAAKRRADAQATLDAGMDRRRADEAREAERRAALADAQALARASQPPAPPEPAPVLDYWPLYGGYVGPVRPHPRPPLAHPPTRPKPPGTGRPPPGAKPPMARAGASPAPPRPFVAPPR